jgi:alkylation response protein AidB-like acyl-CoA dehydrogenase
MDFSFSEEQELLRNSVVRFLADNYSLETFRKVSRGEPGWRREIWKQFAELGLLGASLPEEFGGLGGSAVETMIVMEAFGRALVVEPYVPTVVIAGGFLHAAGSETQKQEWLPRIASGDAIFAFAFAEPQGRYNLADITTTAKKRDGGYVLNGQKAVVIGAPFADALIVTARTDGDRRDSNGVSVFLVGARAKGISRRDYPTGGKRDRRAGRRFAADRTGNRRSHCGALRGSAWCHARVAGIDGRIREDTQAVWRADWQIPGAAAPHGRHAHAGGAVGLDGADGDAEAG